MPGRAKLELYLRGQEAIEFLIDSGGFVELSKAEFATAMGVTYGRAWLRADGTGNRTLVEEVANLTRDQDQDERARELFAGMVISYSPTVGGMVLVDPDGDLSLEQQLHMMKGDLLRQQVTKTVNRRRLSYWKASAQLAMKVGEYDLARLLSHIENEIDGTGFVSDTLVAEFLRHVHESKAA